MLCSSKKLDYTSQQTFAEAKKEKREEYLREISKINSKKLVYSSESGIDENEATAQDWTSRSKRCYTEERAKSFS